MEPRTSQAEFGRETDSPAGTAYRWDVPGRSATIFIDYDLVDRLGFEIMRGFGAVPKRGAEVGGILLGIAEMVDRMLVLVVDFFVVPCEYFHGQCYVFSEKELPVF